MEAFHFRPIPAEMERHREHVQESNPWWVVFDEPWPTRFFCSREYGASVVQADFGMSWAGLGSTHWPHQRPTDQVGTLCFEFEVPIERMAVEERFMGGWMHVVRSNGYHGHYRKAGTDKEYRF